MTRAEVARIVERYLEKYREMGYPELVAKIGKPEIFEGVSANGEKYRIEVDFFFDDEKTKNLRVTGMISYSLWTGFSPVTSDFIIAPNGNFIGE